MWNIWTEGWHPCFWCLWSVLRFFLLFRVLCLDNICADGLTASFWSWLFLPGDNFFKSASYSIEALCAAPFMEEKANLRAVEAEILGKRVEISKFETEYREVCTWLQQSIFVCSCLSLFVIFVAFRQVLAQFTEMTSRYAQEMQAVSLTCQNLLLISTWRWGMNRLMFSEFSLLILVLQIDELLRLRNEIHASYTIAPPMKRSSSKSRNKGPFRETKEDAQVRDKKPTRDRSKKKKWFNIHLKVDKRKPC